MKLNRSLTVIVLLVVLAACTSVLISGCATTGDGKDAEPETESLGQVDKQSTAAERTSGSNPEVKKQPVAYAGGSEQKQHVQDASIPAEGVGYQQYAASVRQALDRILPEALSGLNWNRIITILVGLLMLSMIYGLAFALGRLPARRRGVGSRGGGRQTMEQAEGSVPQ
jgi:hypothetical protein